jgi:hypothetical membrane protein
VTCAYTDPVDNPPVRYICSPLHTLFNASLVASGILIIIGVLLTSPVWGRGVLPTTARALIGLGAFGYVLAGAGAADANLGVHLLGALLALAVANVGLIVAAPALGRGSLASLRAPTLIIGLVALAAAILHFNRVYLGLGMGGMERVAAFALLLWLTIVAVTVLSGRRPRSW